MANQTSFKPGESPAGQRFVGGKSGNPGGRPSIGKALQANGTNTTDVLAKLAKIALDLLDDTKASEKQRGYAHQWLTHYILGKPKEFVEHSGSVGTPATRNWSAVPIGRRRELLAAAEEIAALGTSPGDASGDSPTEH